MNSLTKYIPLIRFLLGCYVIFRISMIFFWFDTTLGDILFMLTIILLIVFIIYVMQQVNAFKITMEPLTSMSITYNEARRLEEEKQVIEKEIDFYFVQRIRYFLQSMKISLLNFILKTLYSIATTFDLDPVGEFYNDMLTRTKEKILRFYIENPDLVYSPFLDIKVKTHDNFFEIFVDQPKNFSLRDFRHILARRAGKYMNTPPKSVNLTRTRTGYKFFAPLD